MPDLAWLCMIFNGTKVEKNGNLLKINTSDRLLLFLVSTAGLRQREHAHSETTVDCKLLKTNSLIKTQWDNCDLIPYPQDKKGGAEKYRLSKRPQ